MKKKERVKVGISIGDPNGIGLEVVLKTFSDKRMIEFCTPIIFASTKMLSAYRKQLNMTVAYNGIMDVSQAIDGRINVLNIWRDDIQLELGKPTKYSGKLAYESLQRATESLQKGTIDTLVTAPINKDNIQSKDFRFAGHTEYLENQLEGKSLMILMKDNLRVGLITGHIPISKVAESITSELIKEKVELMYQSLVQDFGISKPKIAVLGLNPHCGDGGVIGKEDDEIIRPTLESLQKKKKIVYGPYAADGFFGTGNYEAFDGILAMYHDQGLAPFKTLSFGKGVNYTAGLNKIRTSPDHGTAYEIAGRGIANEQSFKEAVFQAIEIFKVREEFFELKENALETTKK